MLIPIAAFLVPDCKLDKPFGVQSCEAGMSPIRRVAYVARRAISVADQIRQDNAVHLSMFTLLNPALASLDGKRSARESIHYATQGSRCPAT